MTTRRFELHRDIDLSGISGTGLIAEGVLFSDGAVTLRWLSTYPTTANHDRGMASIEHVHGHCGATRVVWIDPDPGIDWTLDDPIGSGSLNHASADAEALISGTGIPQGTTRK